MYPSAWLTGKCMNQLCSRNSPVHDMPFSWSTHRYQCKSRLSPHNLLCICKRIFRVRLWYNPCTFHMALLPCTCRLARTRFDLRRGILLCNRIGRIQECWRIWRVGDIASWSWDPHIRQCPYICDLQLAWIPAYICLKEKQRSCSWRLVWE